VTSHLSQDQMTEWVLGTTDQAILRHLETCPACTAEVQEFRNTLSSFREAVHATTEQQLRLRKDKILAAEPATARDWYPLHWGWVLAMVVVLITAIFLARAPNAPHNYAGDDADNALLQAVQGDLDREVPQALAPAVLIAEERNQILTSEDAQPAQTTAKKSR